MHVNTRKQVGDRDHLKVFASEVAADTWLQENDPEGVAFASASRTAYAMLVILVLAVV